MIIEEKDVIENIADEQIRDLILQSRINWRSVANIGELILDSVIEMSGILNLTYKKK